MIPTSFNYKKVASIDEAINLLDSDNEAKLLAGGHSLLPIMKLRLSSPSQLVDISGIEELKYIRDEGDYLSIGAGSSHYDIESSELIKSKAPILSQAAGMIGDMQVRNKGTIGGSLAHADPASDYPAVILACEGTIVAKGSSGERKIISSEFFRGIFDTALGPNEIITEIRIPQGISGSCYLKFPQPASRFALVGCAVIVEKDDNGNCKKASVAFNGVGTHAFRDTNVEAALVGQTISTDIIETAANKAAEGVDALSDHFASSDYRIHLAKIYAKRAIKAALE